MKSVSNIAIALSVIFSTAVNVNAQDAGRIFFVKVNNTTSLQGQIVDVEELKVETAFGEVTIPFEKIEAIKMRAGTGNTAAIAFVNGDLVTGKIQLDKLHLKTSWGKAHINSDAIDSISGSQYGNFYADPNGGWRYSRGSSAGANRVRGFNNPSGSGSRGFSNPGR